MSTKPPRQIATPETKKRRAENAAREASQDVIEQAEKRARVTKEEYELSTKRLDEQLANAKVRS